MKPITNYFKKNIVILLLTCTALIAGCKKYYDNAYYGKWRLIEVITGPNKEQGKTINLVENGIIYEFKRSDKLIITGNIPDTLSVFDDFQVGKHECKYQYWKNCDFSPHGIIVDNNNFYEFDFLFPEYDVMYIYSREDPHPFLPPAFHWHKTFIKIK